MKLELIKEEDYGKVYQGNNCRIYYVKEGKIVGNNNVNPNELIYLLRGELEVTIEEKTQKIKSPAKFEIEENTYHKFAAKSEVIFEVYD